MNDDRSRESTSTESIVDASSRPASTSARRRFLVSGAKLAPVVAATLASRPSLACHCVMPSAWGSINTALGVNHQEMGDTELVNRLSGSVKRYGSIIQKDFSPYYISAWTNPYNDAAWLELATKFPSFPSTLLDGLSSSSDRKARKVAYLKGNYSRLGTPARHGRPAIPAILPLTVGALCTAIGFTPPSGGEAGLPLATIAAGGFKASILVAELNYFLGKLPSSGCVTKAALNQMASGYYLPSGVAAADAWTSTNGQIADYLHYNWIARRQ